MTESAAILIHLGLAHPESGLLPADAARRAQVLRGLVYIAANCYAAIGIIDYPERWCARCRRGDARSASARARRRGCITCGTCSPTRFPRSLSSPASAPGALDLMAAVVSKWSGARKHLAASRPAFTATLARIEADPRVAPVFARHWPAIPDGVAMPTGSAASPCACPTSARARRSTCGNRRRAFELHRPWPTLPPPSRAARASRDLARRRSSRRSPPRCRRASPRSTPRCRAAAGRRAR